MLVTIVASMNEDLARVRALEGALAVRGIMVLSIPIITIEEGGSLSKEQEIVLTDLHFEKIEMSDAVYVIGDATDPLIQAHMEHAALHMIPLITESPMDTMMVYKKVNDERF